MNKDELRAKMKAVQAKAWRKEKPATEREPEDCPDVVPYSPKTDTAAAARYRAAQETRMHLHKPEESLTAFGEAAVGLLCEVLERVLDGDVKATIDVHTTKTEDNGR